MLGLKNIDYLGSVSFEQSNELMEKSSVFVNTSLREGFPNTFIQAWMRNVPTVSLSVDPDNLIEKNQIGFHSKSIDQLIKDVRYLIKNADVLASMGCKASHFARTNFAIVKNTDIFENNIKEMLKNGSCKYN